ncbi:MAG: ABC transporter substrate-binding protein [Desulfovibrionaceae bacterium]|nr:ABC transporter substrate-binding protein [Desulfovibrionaceae bacterium]
MFSRNKGMFWVGLLVIVFSLSATMALAAPKEIRFGYLVADLHSPAVMIMKEKKLLEAAGFTAKWSEFLAGSYLMQDMAAGSINFGTCGAVPAMITHAQGVKMAVLASVNGEGSSLVVTDNIKTIKDLDGKKIGTPGTGSIQDAMIAQLATANNIRIQRMSMKVSDMPLFLDKKEIDGFIAWAPHPSRAVALGYGHELLTSHDMMPGHQCCVLLTTEKTLKEDPETVEALLKVYLEAYRWFLDNQDESVAIMAKSTGMDENIVRAALKTVKYPYPPFVNTASMKSMAADLIEQDKIVNVKVADLDAFIKSLYRPELLEKLTNTKAPAE